MFKRLILENWMAIFPLVAFAVTATVYLLGVVRAARLTKDQSDKLAKLPLDLEN